MKIIVDFCLIPLEAGISLSKYITACQQILDKAGLKTQLHAYGTNIEGDWDVIMETIKQCHIKVHSMGAPRINTTLKVGSRIDREQTMQEKIDSVKAKMDEDI